MAGSEALGKSVERGWFATLSAGLLALLVIRLVALRLNATDLFFDEAQYWSWSVEPAFGYYSKPPLIAWVIRLATESCGVSEFCVRLPSPLIHTGTALVIFALGKALYDIRVGVLGALAFATLPGVSLSSGIISTDVPLLFFWALALLALVWMLESEGWGPALLLGVALGLGLNAKYAMAWFVLSLLVYVAVTPHRRSLLTDGRLYAALAIAAVLIAPNLAWNAAHKFATFSHTADNAKWGGALLNPHKALEFVGAQFGVFGPILFASLLVVTARAYRRGLPEQDRLLLAFTLPLLVVITGQALASRAHANWAAVSYVAGTVLVVATLVREVSWGWLKASFGVHLVLMAVLALGAATAGKFAPPVGQDPYWRTLGWREVAQATTEQLESARRSGKPFGAVVTDDRAVTAELLYYMRGEPTPVLAWRSAGRPLDHYELTRAYGAGSPEPVLLVSLRPDDTSIPKAFANVETIAVRDLPAGAKEKRRVGFHALAGFKGR